MDQHRDREWSCIPRTCRRYGREARLAGGGEAKRSGQTGADETMHGTCVQEDSDAPLALQRVVMMNPDNLGLNVGLLRCQGRNSGHPANVASWACKAAAKSSTDAKIQIAAWAAAMSLRAV